MYSVWLNLPVVFSDSDLEKDLCSLFRLSLSVVYHTIVNCCFKGTVLPAVRRIPFPVPGAHKRRSCYDDAR